MEFPEDMKIPDSRKDTSSIHNVQWLLRNIWIQNGDHPELDRVTKELEEIRLNHEHA